VLLRPDRLEVEPQRRRSVAGAIAVAGRPAGVLVRGAVVLLRTTRFITICLAVQLAMAIAPALATAAPASIVDEDFAGGTDANTIVVAPGSVQLAPIEVLPPDWTVTNSFPWGGGTATASAGVLSVDGALAGPTTTFSAPQTLTFTATFGAESFQHMGFGVDFNNVPDWAMFSTFNTSGVDTTLFARINVGGTAINDDLPGINPLMPHNYRIEWDATEVRFYVDGALVSTQTAALPPNLRVLASDLSLSGTPLTVRDINLAPIPAYPTSGVFLSRVFEAEPRITSWGALTDVATPGVTFTTRTGNTPTPDATWSGFQPLGAGGAIQSPVRRYIQYQAVLTSDGTSTPSIDRVTIAYEYDTAAPSVVISGVTASGTTATVTFSSPDADVVRFECSLDNGPFQSCTSPREYTALSAATHRVRVRAIDQVGNVGPVAERSFVISSPPPPPPPNGDNTAPKVRPKPRSVRVSNTGRFTVRLRCPSDERRCFIMLRLRYRGETIASKRVIVLGGRTANVTLRLKPFARTALLTRARLRVSAVTTARDPSGNRALTRTPMTLRAAR
jgi:hypothetical protein